VIAGEAGKNKAMISTRRYGRSMPHFQLLIPESATGRSAAQNILAAKIDHFWLAYIFDPGQLFSVECNPLNNDYLNQGSLRANIGIK
jgi:hypothetical protein